MPLAGLIAPVLCLNERQQHQQQQWQQQHLLLGHLLLGQTGAQPWSCFQAER